MDINPLFKILISDLLNEEKGIAPYSLYQKYKIAPSTLAEFMAEMKRKGLITLNGNYIVLTEEGRKLLSNDVRKETKKQKRKELKASAYNNKVVAKTYIEVNEPYIPRIETIINILQDRERETSS